MGRVINDDRISGDNRLLAELIALWIDCKIPKRGGQPRTAEEIAEAQHECDFLESVTLSRFARSGNLIRNIDRNDGPPAQIEKDASTLERTAIDEILGRG